MEAKPAFDKAAEIVKKNAAKVEKMKDADKLEIYALFKQATMGDNTVPEPGMFHMKDKAKWTAWKGKVGMAKEKAMTEYVALAAKLLPEEKF